MELYPLIAKPQWQDFVVRTRARREANGMPLMAAELVIAGEETRKTHPLAATYPLHFRKTYFPGRLHGDPQVEYEQHLLASKLSRTPPPIGYTASTFRSCLVPGQSYARLTPFGGEPPENNIAKAQTAAAGDGGGIVAAGRGIAGAAAPASGGRPLARGRRAAQHHRLPGAAGADPDRLRSGGAEGDAGERRVGGALQDGPAAAPARGRSTCSARSAGRRVRSESARGISSASCSDRRNDFSAPSRRAPRSERAI